MTSIDKGVATAFAALDGPGRLDLLLDFDGTLAEIVAELAGFLDTARTIVAPHGLLVENKGLAVTVHYRSLEPRAARPVVRALWSAGRDACHSGLVSLVRGKRVIELRARGADKGRAASFLLTRWGSAGRCVAIGDDTTDEDMFQEVARRDGVSIKVGTGLSAARHRLADPSKVEALLVELAVRQCP